MGNTLSSEATPQRLSKPRPQLDLPTNLVPPPDFATCCEFDNRYRHCYLAASRPLLHLDLPSPGPDVALDSCLSSPISLPRLSWQPLDSTEPPSGSTKSSLKHRLSRANSLACQTGAGVCSLTRSHRSASEAAHLFDGTDLGTSSVGSDGMSVKDLHQEPSVVMESHPQSFPSSLLRRRQNSCPPIQLGLQTSTSSQTHDSESQPSHQGSPVRSSLIPVRQRSLYLTPGVATRNVKDNPCSPTKPVIRIGPPIAEAKDSFDSDSSSSSDCHRLGVPSMFPPSCRFDSQHRPVTPCEANYRQLGGIKFGTLRITNGSPVPSPAGESDDEASRRMVQTSTSAAKDHIAANSSMTSVYESEASPSRQGSVSSSTGHGAARVMPSPSTSPAIRRQPSPRAAEKRLTETEFTSPEVLDIRDDPHAKPQADRDTARPSAANQDDSVARSDSGFASTSTSSRNSSQRTVSKADSGFSSSFSLPSIQSDGVLSTQNPPAGSSLSSQCTSPKEVEVVTEEPGRMPRWRSSQSTRSAISSMSREVIRRLSNRSSKSFKSLSLDGVPTSAQDGPSWPAFNDSAASPDTSQEAVYAPLDRKPEKQGRLLRLLSGGRRQSSADVYLPSYSVPDYAPAVPVNLRDKLHTRIGHIPTVPKKDFRLDPNHQPLQTILSVESLPLDQANDEKLESPPPPPLPAKSPRFNPLASAASLSPKMLIRRKPVGSGPKTPSKTPLAKSPLDMTKAAQEPPAYQQSLASRASMPDMAASFRTRPLPPVPQQQPRVRTVRNARDMLPSRAVPDALSGRREPTERYRWMPAPGKKPEVTVSQHPPPRRLGPPVVCRQPQLRQYHDEQGRQQYRTLHSYSSSAYRNMPISG
ncbi:hypothetical protein CP532_2042 [Ophiocordyceps camponoti-leonardi (nom. inval.)]|nr:hypothetical protein CP532_2042 [Ophiocordyceps camponoti-leonardi (nom. inval.)]